VGFGRVPEIAHQTVSFQNLLDDGSLDPTPPAMNQAHLAKSRLVGSLQVLIDH